MSSPVATEGNDRIRFAHISSLSLRDLGFSVLRLSLHSLSGTADLFVLGFDIQVSIHYTSILVLVARPIFLIQLLADSLLLSTADYYSFST